MMVVRMIPAVHRPQSTASRVILISRTRPLARMLTIMASQHANMVRGRFFSGLAERIVNGT